MKKDAANVAIQHSLARQIVKPMVEAYHQKKKSKQIVPNRIARGRSVSVAEVFEEALARYILGFVPQHYQILIDTPLSYRTKGAKRKKTVYPDLIIYDSSKRSIVGILEAKIDLGYLGDGWATKQRSLWDGLQKATDLKLGKNTLLSEQSVTFASSRAKAVFAVVLSDANHKERRKDFESHIGSENCFFLLSHVEHPNSAKVVNIPAYLKTCETPTNSSCWRTFRSAIRDLVV